MDNKIEELVTERVTAELMSIDMENRYNDMLDECYPEFFGWYPSVALQRVDEIQYNCGYSDFVDAENVEEINGEYYDADEVQEIREEIEEKLTEGGLK